jgi:inorganic pyrophosphatase/exopolyphosphatase
MGHVKYESTEAAKCFSFSNLVNKVKTELKEKHPDMDDSTFFDLMNKSLNTFRLNGQTFEYEHQENYLGGFRWYIKCPICGTKSLKLYLPENFEDREQVYACKKCHKLKNTSALMGATSKYQKVVKPLKKLESLKKQLMKKSMKPEKAKELIDEYERIERSLENSPEYRHWKFQQRFKGNE